MFARARIIVAFVLFVLTFSATAQDCRTVRNPETGERWQDCTNFQTANRTTSQGQTNLTVGQVFLLDSRVQYNNPDHVLVRCTAEEEFQQDAKRLLTLTFASALKGWAITDNREGAGLGSRIGLYNGVNATLQTQCMKVVARPAQQRVVVVTRTVEVSSSETLRPCNKGLGSYGMMTDKQCEAMPSAPVQVSALPTKNANGDVCFLQNKNGVLVYDFFSTGANNPLGKPIVTGQECFDARKRHGGN